MEINLKNTLNISLNQEEIDKLINELNWLAETYDYQVETLLDIREEVLKQCTARELQF